MSARDDILRALADRPAPSPAPPGASGVADLDAAAAALLVGAERPVVAAEAVETIFAERLTLPSVAASLATVATMAEVPAAVAAYCAEQALPLSLCMPADPRLAASDWSAFERHTQAAPDEPVALAVAECGVAETGSLVMRTGPHAPMLPNFLALHHIVVVPRLVAYLEEAVLPGPAPRADYWITGVSGTTDIEGTYVRGAHGPRFLHVVRVLG
ncbi:LutC/YkgG family protein [Sphingomonas sp. MA1305]|uniref:LutC/YkgG family protein n=1 Tax=Sphingomonas sp. MA1305 TaxID=2479204 RepID=UPI002FCD4645